MRRHLRLDLGAPRREGLDHRARYARDLEAPVGVGLLYAIAQRLQASRQFGPVEGADEHFGGIEPVIGLGAPFAVRALHHVGDHRMGVELGIEIARGVVAEGGDHGLLASGTDHAAALGIHRPGLDGVVLDPGEGSAHGGVMCRDDPLVAAGQGGE